MAVTASEYTVPALAARLAVTTTSPAGVPAGTSTQTWSPSAAVVTALPPEAASKIVNAASVDDRAGSALYLLLLIAVLVLQFGSFLDPIAILVSLPLSPVIESLPRPPGRWWPGNCVPPGVSPTRSSDGWWGCWPARAT